MNISFKVLALLAIFRKIVYWKRLFLHVTLELLVEYNQTNLPRQRLTVFEN
jgi:hypothetical protein